jgi:DNA-binding Lrp family transcriptional regulator
VLDAIDAAILRALQNDARLPNKDLAAMVNVAPSTCLVRQRALRDRGVITGYTAEVDLGALGRPLQAMVAVRIRPHTRAVVETFLDYVLELPETMTVTHVAGPDDFIVHVAVADATHLQRLLLDGFTTRKEVAQLHTNLVFEHHRRRTLTPTAEVLS